MQQQPLRDINLRKVNLAIASTCCVLLFALIALVINLDIRQLQDDLDTEIDHAYNQLLPQLNSTSTVLNSFNAYFQAVDTVNFKHIEDFSASIREQYPFIYMTQYIYRVSHDELEEFIARRKYDGFADYKILQYENAQSMKLVAADVRDIYYPLVFMDPLTVRTAPMLGFDTYSYGPIREAIDYAIESGKNQATLPFTLEQGMLAYLILKPIYTTDMPPEYPELRRLQATRIVAMVIRIADLLENIALDAHYTLKLVYPNNIEAVKSASAPTRSSTAPLQHLLPSYETRRKLHNAGQQYELVMQRQLHWRDIEYDWIIFVLIATAAVSILLFNFVHLRVESSRERHIAQAALFREKEMAEVTLHSIGEAVITTDLDQNIKYMNPVAIVMTGWELDAATQQPLEVVFNLVNEATRQEVDSIVYECLQRKQTVSFDFPTLLLCKDGKEYAIENSAAPISDHSGKIVGAVLVFRNITHIRNLSKKMEYQSTHDSLTGLINRREFEQQLKQAVLSAREQNHQHALCYIDLDQFKIVNDTCGHIAGDQLLRELAKLMPHSIRASDCLARLGGDEFGLLMFDCPLKQAIKVADALKVAIKEFHFSWDKKTFEIGASIGLVPINRDSGSLQDILRCADASCYLAKDTGRNRVHVYTPDDAELTKRHGEMQWLPRIQLALEQGRFQLALQTIRATRANPALPHKEILIRMRDEDGTIVPPMSFIPAAERYDVMATLDRWVISTSLSLMQTELSSAAADCVYNINLSGQTLCDPDIADFIASQIELHNINAQHICFEITETAVIANLSIAIDFINKMKAIGCLFALDDFGSGLSSFSYLKKLPVDFIKIDGEFVRDILSDPMDRAIVTAINNIGHEMGLQTVAEYVENASTLALLTEIGVDFVQGYGIEHPQEWRQPTPDNVVQIKKA